MIIKIKEIELSSREDNFKQECCLLIANNKLLSVNTDHTPDHVDFDFFAAWAEYKKNPFSELIMLHTHPVGCPNMSNTDFNMVHGWMKSFPVPIWFFITTQTEVLTTTGYLCFKGNIIKLVELPSSAEGVFQYLWFASCGKDFMIEYFQSKVNQPNYFDIQTFKTKLRILCDSTVL